MSSTLPRAAAVADRRVTGLSREVLAELVAELGPRWQARQDDRPRRRAVGAGAQYRLVFLDRLLATLVHLRHGVTHDVLACWLGVSRSTITRAIGEVGPLLAILLTTFAVISVNVAEGVKSLPKDLIDMAKSFGVGVVRRNRQIVIPHLMPFIFTGVRFGFSLAWKVTVLTEVFSSSSGIGFEMRTATQLFRLPEFLTWILAFYLFALFLEKVVLEQIERRFFGWRRTVTS